MSDQAKANLDKAVEIVDQKFGAGASNAVERSQLVAAILQQIVSTPEETSPAISKGRLGFAVVIFFWWLALLVGGNEVNSEPARRLLRSIGQIQLSEDATAKTTNELGVTPTTGHPVVFKVILDGKEIAIGTNTLPSAAAPPPLLPEKNLKNIAWALVVAILFWTWPNLIFLASASSAMGAVLTRYLRSGPADLTKEIAWAMIKGFFVVVFLGCSQVFLGDSVYKSLGLNEALQIQIKQDRYLSLAFFASLLGLFLGLARQRLSEVPGRLPVIGLLFRK